MGDPLFLQMKQHNSAAGVVGRVKKSSVAAISTVLLSRVTDTGKLRNIAIAEDSPTSCACCQITTPLSGQRIVFVDLYGVPQFEHALCTFMAKKPLFMIGHSVGPFGMSNLTNWRTMSLVIATR